MSTTPAVPEPAAGTEVDIRVPLWSRVWVLGFGVVWCCLVVLFGSRSDGGATRFLVPALLVLFMVGLAWRVLVQGIRTEGDQLVVRGPFSTRRADRGEISDVTQGESGQFPGLPCVVVTTGDHRSISAPPLSTLPFGESARRQVDAQVQQVRAWVGLAR